MMRPPSVEDYARMSEAARFKAAELARRQLAAIEQAEARRAERRQALDAQTAAFYAEADAHRHKALVRWHDSPIVQRARREMALADVDNHRENRTAA